MPKFKYQPPFTLTSDIVSLVAEVAATIGRAVSMVERAAAKLQAEGKLRYHDPKKGGRWEVL